MMPPQVAMGYDWARIFAWVAQLAGLKNISQFKVQVVPDAVLAAQAASGKCDSDAASRTAPGLQRRSTQAGLMRWRLSAGNDSGTVDMDRSELQQILTDAKNADRIDRERAEMFVSMVRSPAWREYIALLEAEDSGLRRCDSRAIPGA